MFGVAEADLACWHGVKLLRVCVIGTLKARSIELILPHLTGFARSDMGHPFILARVRKGELLSGGLPHITPVEDYFAGGAVTDVLAESIFSFQSLTGFAGRSIETLALAFSRMETFASVVPFKFRLQVR